MNCWAWRHKYCPTPKALLVPEGLKVHRIRYCPNSCQQLLCYTLYYRYKYNFIGQRTAPWLFPFRLNRTNISCLKMLILDRQRAVNIAFVWLVELTFVLLDFLLVITTCTKNLFYNCITKRIIKQIQLRYKKTFWKLPLIQKGISLSFVRNIQMLDIMDRLLTKGGMSWSLLIRTL